MSRVGIALRLQHRERIEALLKGPDELARVVRRQARAARVEKKLSRAVIILCERVVVVRCLAMLSSQRDNIAYPGISNIPRMCLAAARNPLNDEPKSG